MWCARKSGVLQRSVKVKSVPKNRNLHKTHQRLQTQGNQSQPNNVPPSKSNNTTLKIVGGLTLVMGGGLAGALYYASINPDVRKQLEHYVPYSSSLLDQIAIMPKDNYSNNNNKTIDDQPSLLRPVKSPPVVTTPSETFQEEKTSTEKSKPDAEAAKPDSKIVKEDAKKKRARDSVVISAVDQPTVSSVDLDIQSVTKSKPAEKLPEQVSVPVTKQTQIPEKSTEAKGKAVVVMSALDVPGVSSVDLDIPTPHAPKPSDKHFTSLPEEEKQAVLPVIEQESPKVEETSEEEHIEETIVLPVVPPPVDLTPLQEKLDHALEKLSSLGQTAIHKHSEAVSTIQQHSQHMKSLHNAEQGEDWDKLWSECVNASQASEQAQMESTTSAVVAHEQVDNVQHLIKEIQQLGGEDIAAEAAEVAAKVTYDVQTAAVNLQQAKSTAEVENEYHKLVDEGKERLEKEFVDLVQREQEQAELNKVEAALVSFAQKRIEFLNGQLAQREAEEKARLNHALTRQQEEDKKLAEMVLEQEKLRAEQEHQSTLKKVEEELSDQHEMDLRRQLRRQAAAFGDHLSDVLRVQSQELSEKHHKEITAKLQEEKEMYEFKLRGAIARLRGVESAIESRAEVDELNRKAQELWLACKSLATALTGSGSEHSEDLSVLKNEILAVSEAGAGSPLVQEILASIPTQATTSGVSTEEDLRNRFSRVSRVCRRVGTVGEQGGGLWTYALSYFQSFLVFNTFDPKKSDDLVDPQALSNFDVLSRAEYFVNIGDIEQATRYMNQLKGESRRVAKDWVNEARVLLETKQAAKFLTAYASACELGNLEQ